MLHKAAATRQVQRYDEPETLSYQILQASAIGADEEQKGSTNLAPSKYANFFVFWEIVIVVI